MDEQLRLETGIALGEDLSREAVEGLVESVYSCPDCGGVLWTIDDGEIHRYRCRTGHAYSEDSLFLRQSDNLEGALWAAVRVLSENAELTNRLMQRARERGDERVAQRFNARLAGLMQSMETIRAAINANGEQGDVELEEVPPEGREATFTRTPSMRTTV